MPSDSLSGALCVIFYSCFCTRGIPTWSSAVYHLLSSVRDGGPVEGNHLVNTQAQRTADVLPA